MNKCFIVIKELIICQLLNDHTAPTVWAKKLFMGNFAFKKTIAAQATGIFIRYPHVSSLFPQQTACCCLYMIIVQYNVSLVKSEEKVFYEKNVPIAQNYVVAIYFTHGKTMIIRNKLSRNFILSL